MLIAVVSFLNGILFSLYCYLVCFIILEKRQTNFKIIINATIPFLASYYFVLCLLDSIFAIFFSGLISFIFIKIVFKESNYISLFLSLIIHIIKYTFKKIILIIINNDKLLILNTYESLDWNAMYIDLATIIISLLFIVLFRKILRKVIKKVSSLKNRGRFLLFITYASFALILYYQPPKNIASIQTITDLSIIFVVSGLGIFNITTEKKTEYLIKHYQEIFEYSKSNEELLAHYKMQVHENKNRLIMIKGLLDGPKKEIVKYIDLILKEINDNKNLDNYWLAELKYIPLAGVKNFINYKLVKLRDLNAEIEVFVSSELEKICVSSFNENDYNQLSTILGVVMDNMIESVYETKEKLVSINIYLEDDAIHAEFVNSFAGKIDLSRLSEVGYTTKGEQHGIGLALVDKIIKMNDRFDCKAKIVEKFFVQDLIIKVYDKNNLQKIAKK